MSAAQKNLRNYMRQNCVSDEKSLWNKGRASIQGQALHVRSARQTARTIEVRAVLRHFVPNKGMPPLRRLRVYFYKEDKLPMKEIPIWEKSNLSLEEAAAYSGIGINKLREITNEDRCKFVLWVGNKRLIKRRLFDQFIEQAYSI